MRPTYKHPKMELETVTAPVLGVSQGIREINNKVRDLLTKIEVLVIMMEHQHPEIYLDIQDILDYTECINKILMEGENDLNDRSIMLRNLLFSALK